MKKRIVTITGPSGSGKTNLIQKTFKPNQILKSLTTRQPRPHEELENNYIFCSEDDFHRAQKGDYLNGLVQEAFYDGHYYGVAKKEITDALKLNDTVVVAVVQDSVKDFIRFGIENNIEVIPVFTAISKEMLLKHFESRLESETQKQHRIEKYETEMANKKFYNEANILDMTPDDFGESASQTLKFEILNQKSMIAASWVNGNQPHDGLDAIPTKIKKESHAIIFYSSLTPAKQMKYLFDQQYDFKDVIYVDMEDFDVPYHTAIDFDTLSFQIPTSSNMAEIVDYIENRNKENAKFIISCQMGISRTGAIVDYLKSKGYQLRHNSEYGLAPSHFKPNRRMQQILGILDTKYHPEIEVTR